MTYFDANDTQDEGDGTKSDEPPTRNLGVLGHEAGMNVIFVFQVAAELADDIMAVPEERVDYNRRIGRENRAVRDSVGDR